MMEKYDVHSIKDKLKKCLGIVPSSMPTLTEALLTSIKKLDEPMQLALIGKISSSKSTLVNAILGKNELMQTGQKEVTYNVGWLKYGDPESDIIVHYKNGSAPQRKKRREFVDLSVNTGSDIEKIRYLEVFDDNEILKEINIIDTPGLDALRGKDTQNTLDFIQEVRPDAVIMLFTHSVAENTLEVVRQFNAGTNLTPLNAIGVLTKIDVLWQETIPRLQSAVSIGQKIVSSKMRKDENLRRTLFNMYPVSSLLFLASETMDEKDVDDIKKAYMDSADSLKKALTSVAKFLADDNLCISQCRRKELIAKLGLYGISLIVKELDESLSAGIGELKQVFYRESGAETFMKILRNHFASRSKLIKLESVFQLLGQTMQEIRSQRRISADLTALSIIEQRVSDIFSSLVFEHLQYEMLNRIYAGELIVEESVRTEFCTICGEYGTSAPERLGLPCGTEVNVLVKHSLLRENFWRKEIALEPDPEERAWMNVMLKSYTLLRQQLQANWQQYMQTKAFLFNE